MKHIFKALSLGTALILLAASCKHDHDHGDHHGHDHRDVTHSEDSGHDHGNGHEDEGMYLTQIQIETIGMEFGTFSHIKVNDFIKATGVLDVPANGITSLSPKADGIIRSSRKLVDGEYIKKGALIAYLENPEFIILQQDYLEAKATLEFMQSEVERQQSLVDANAGVKKKLQQMQAKLQAGQAKSQGLAKQLAYLGIDADHLTVSTITERVSIHAPTSGYISEIELHNGMHVTPTYSLLKIINNSHLHLELDVFEKDIAKVQKGQKITYSIPALGTQIYDGEISVIGKEFNTDNKTVRVHGHLENTKPTFVKNLFINAKIWLNDQSSTAVPEEAIIRDAGSSFIYAGQTDKYNDNVEFMRVMIKPGATDNGYTTIELIDHIPPGYEVVTKGAYYIYAQSKAGELTHEH